MAILWKSTGLLILPLLAVNILLAPGLPAAFADNVAVPSWLTALENTTRMLVFAAPFFVPLKIRTPVQRRALAGFIVGSVANLASWVPLLVAPDSDWVRSSLGFLAPAYTPALWLLPLGLWANRLELPRWGTARFVVEGMRPWMFWLVCLVFLVSHITHVSFVHEAHLVGLGDG